MKEQIYEGQVGDILVCKGSSWISRAIMKITKGEWSHTALYAEAWGRKGIVEAQKNGVNFKLWETWLDKWGYEYVAFRRELPAQTNLQVHSHRMMVKAFEKCGETKYDFFTFFRRAFGDRKKRSAQKENKKFICSEFTAYIHNLPEGYDMTPQEQYDYLVNSTDWKQVS